MEILKVADVHMCKMLDVGNAMVSNCRPEYSQSTLE